MSQDDDKQVASPVPDWYVKAMSDAELSEACAKMGDAVTRLNGGSREHNEMLAMRDQIVLEQADRRAGRSRQVSALVSEAEALHESGKYPSPATVPRPLETPAGPDAEVRLSTFFQAHGIAYRGAMGAGPTSGQDHSLSGWNHLDRAERTRRVALAVCTAFDAIQRVVKVDGRGVAGRPALAIHIESINTTRPPTRGARIGGVYTLALNTFAVDTDSNDSLAHEFGHYLDFAAGSRYNGGRATGDVEPIPVTAIVPSWRKFVDDLKDTQAHHHFVFKSGLDPHYTQMASEVLARFFEG